MTTVGNVGSGHSEELPIVIPFLKTAPLQVDLRTVNYLLGSNPNKRKNGLLRYVVPRQIYILLQIYCAHFNKENRTDLDKHLRAVTRDYSTSQLQGKRCKLGIGNVKFGPDHFCVLLKEMVNG